MAGIIGIIGVIVGFYLAKYKELNPKIAKTIKNIKKPRGYGEPFVVRTDEAKLEKEQLKQQDKEKLDLKDIL